MNERIFSQINDQNTAYWLGFLAADGSCSSSKRRLMIGLSAKDKEHLQNFAKFLDSNNPILERNTLCSNNGKRYPTVYFTIISELLLQDLAQYGIIDKKSSINIDFLQYIPEPYKFAFICGIFDGDGWFSFTEKTQSFGFCGNELTTKSIISYLTTYLNWDSSLIAYNYKKSIYTYYFSSQAKNKLLSFCKAYMDLEEQVDLLPRKKRIAANLIEYLETRGVCHNRTKTNTIVIAICKHCGKEFAIHRGSDYCSQECVHLAQRRAERPCREELKKLIRSTSFLQLGKIYNVSDNTIRKWCKAENLPHRSSDIKKYTDEEWNLI